MIVISDTSPLNYLALIGQTELLHKLFGQVVVPQAVVDELTHPAAPEAVKKFLASSPPWLQIRRASHLDTTLPKLGAGETEAISLAGELHADLLLCDDGDARKAAMRRGIRVAGTLGVLESAAISGLIDLPTCLEQLLHTTLRMPEEIVARMLNDDRERKARK